MSTQVGEEKEFNMSGKNNIFRNLISQLAAASTDAAVVAVASQAGLPAGLTLALTKGAFKGIAQGVIQSCYDDVVNRILSSREVEKHDRVFAVAERTFLELAEEDNLASMVVCTEESQFKYAYEVAEHLTLEAIRQSENTKVDILGRFYGSSYYYWKIDWQDMHHIISMVSALSLRQIILIRLINEGFPSIDHKLYITNPSVCVELHRLLEYGVWCTEGAAFGIDNSASIQISSLIPTSYSDSVSSALMLDKISEEDVQRVIDSLKLSEGGIPVDVLTKEDYKANTEWMEIDENGNRIINGGTFGNEDSGTAKDYWK